MFATQAKDKYLTDQIYKELITSQVAILVKNLPAIAGDIRSLGWEDPLEEGTATHSSVLAWRIPTVHRVAQSRTGLERLNTHKHAHKITTEKNNLPQKNKQEHIYHTHTHTHTQTQVILKCTNRC